MSCPNWPALVSSREANGLDPEGWPEACSHLEVCARCREEALALDPLLIFRRLPAPRVTAVDVEAMKQGVAAMIRASRVEGSRPEIGRPFSTREPWSQDDRGLWQRLKWPAAAAAVLVVSLTLGAPPVGAPPVARLTTSAASKPVAGEVREVLAAVSLSDEQGSFEGTIEDLSLADARVYEVASDGLSVVTIVHPSLTW